MEYPEWVLEHKRKGTELRCINGKYYLYEVTSRWNPDKKRAQKITGPMLGRITEEDGFVPSKRYKKTEEVQSVCVKEYGASGFIKETVAKELMEKLKEYFPQEHTELFCMALFRLIYQSPIKNMDLHYINSYLSDEYGSIKSLKDKRCSGILKTVGEKRDKIASFFKSAITKDNYLLIDATDVLSHSKELGINRKGYSSKMLFEPQVNLMFIFSETLKQPVYYRILPGDIKEVKAFRLCLEESGIKQAVLIADKGFYSKNNIERLDEENLNYIIPLRRNITLIDYTPLKKGNKRSMNGYFKYRDKYIWYYSRKINNKILYVYFDEYQKNRETKDYMNRIETHPENYFLENFYEKEFKFGTFVLYTNLSDSEENSAESVYNKYKCRNNIEVMNNVLKNLLHADRTYMRNEKSLEGWMFVNYLALQIYYKIYLLLNKHNLLKKYSVNDLLIHLATIKKIKINQKWFNAEINVKTLKLIDKLDIHIT